LSTLLNPFVFFRQVFEGYGQTETTAAATLQMIGDQTYGEKRNQLQIESVSSCPRVSACVNYLEFLMVCLILVRNWRDIVCIVDSKGVLRETTRNDDFLRDIVARKIELRVRVMLHDPIFSGATLELGQPCCRFLNRFQKLATCYCNEMLR